MQQRCPNCLFTGKAKFGVLDDFRIPLAGFFLGLAFFWISVESFSITNINFRSVFYLFFFTIFVLFGIYLIISYYSKYRDLCPKCNYGHMAIVDTSEINEPSN